MLAVQPKKESDLERCGGVYSRVNAATRSLVNGDLDAAGIDERFLNHAKVLSDISSKDSRAIPIRIWVRKEPISITPEVAEYIRKWQGISYTDYGTVEGFLKSIQDARGTLEFKVL